MESVRVHHRTILESGEAEAFPSNSPFATSQLTVPVRWIPSTL
jgi:hypothetical protein